MTGLLNPTLEMNRKMADDAARLAERRGEFNQTMDLAKNKQEAENLQGMVGGVTQAAMLPLAYQSAKNQGWLGGKPAVAGTESLLKTSQGQVGAASAPAGVQSAVTPQVPGYFAGDTAGALGAVPAAPGLLSTAGASVGPAGLGVVGGNILGQGIAKMTGMHQKTAGQVGGVIGGAGVGFAVGGPVGGVIGGIIGGISSLF